VVINGSFNDDDKTLMPKHLHPTTPPNKIEVNIKFTMNETFKYIFV